MSLLGRKRTRYDSVFTPKPKKPAISQCQDDLLFLGLEDFDYIPNDTQTALQILRTQATHYPPIILKSHLFFLIKERTSLERELMELQYEFKLREFKLPFSSDTYYIFTDDLVQVFEGAKQNYYEDLLKPKKTNSQEKIQAKSHLQCGTLTGPPAIGNGLRSVPFTENLSQKSSVPLSKKNEEKLKVFDLFVDNIILKYVGSTIDTETVLKSMFPSSYVGKRFDCLTPLIQCGALLFLGEGRAQHQGLQLGCPNAGGLLGNIKEGRKIIIGRLKRKRYREEYASNIENTNIDKSIFPTSFHLKDLLGNDLVEQIETPDGLLIRLPG